MMRTPPIVGSGLVAALLSVQLPAAAQVPPPNPAPAAPSPASPVPAQPTASPAATPASTPPATAPQAPAVPRPNQIKAAPVEARKTGGESEEDEASRQLAARLEPTPGGLTAEEVVRKTLANSPSLQKSEYEADKAAANKARAKLAFAPRIDLMASYTRLSDIKLNMNFTDPSNPIWVSGSNPGPFGPYLNQYGAVASATLPITDWFLTIIPTYRGAAKVSEVAEQQRRAQELQVAFDARIAFYEYVHALGGRAVALASVRVLEASVKDLESLVQVGASTPTELARARAARANAEALAIQLEGMVKVCEERLSQLTGEAVRAERGIGEPLVGIDFGAAPSVDELISQAKSTRPELKALRTLHDARKHFARARRGQVLPKVYAGANYYYARPNQRFIPQVDEFRGTWDVGVSLAWSPNDAAFAYTQAQDAETELRIVEEDLRGFEIAITVESTNAVSSFTAATASIEAKSEGLEAARRYYSDQRALMLAGAATPNDVLLAERDWTQAALEWVNAHVNARKAQASLLKAQGKTGIGQGPVQQQAVAGSTP